MPRTKRTISEKMEDNSETVTNKENIPTSIEVTSFDDFPKHESICNSKSSLASRDKSSRHPTIDKQLVEINIEKLELELREVEIRKALLEAKLSNSNAEEQLQYESSSSNDSYTSFNTKNLTNNLRSTKSSISHKPHSGNVLQSVINSSNLVKIEIDKFDGSPLQFWSFMKNFETNIAANLMNDSQRLLYLIYYCLGAAKEAISHCTLLPPDEGYQRAIAVLKAQFGRPHNIAQTFIHEILEGGLIPTHDIGMLQQLVRKMVNCEIALNQMNYAADLNCTTNIMKIVERLPKHLQLRWAEKADDILNDGHEPSFHQLIEFLEKRLSVSSNCYGVMASSSKKEPNKLEISSFRNKSYDKHSINVFTREERRCLLCKSDHAIQSCEQFLNVDHTEKLRILRSFKLCFNCLRPNHLAAECRANVRCNEPNCHGKHHSSLHLKQRNVIDTERPNVNINSVRCQNSRLYLGYIPIRLNGPTGTIETYAFLDSGSDTTLIEADIADRIGLKGIPLKLHVSSIHGTRSLDSMEVKFDINSMTGHYRIAVDKAYTVKSLPIRRACIPSEQMLKEWSHLHDINLNRIKQDRVTVLIGGDVPEAHWVLEQRLGTPKQPYASLTPLGWIVLGPSGHCKVTKASINYLNIEDSIRLDMLKMFEMDFNEQYTSTEMQMSTEEMQVLKSVENSVRLVNGHYEVSLPWRDDWRNMVDNRNMAERRLQHLRCKLSRDEYLLQSYREIIDRHVQRGYVSKLVSKTNGPLRFLPHHPVLNPHKPGKVRIVFDCAAKHNGKCLNDYLHAGPDLTNDLTGVLLRFRLHEIALSADIEEMFLQVRLKPDDRKPFCFLWYSDGNLTKKPDVYQLNVHPFGATSSPFCAAFALRQTAKDNRHLCSEQTMSILENNFYVDDCLVSVESLDAAKNVVNELRQLTSLGGFRLHKWVSNDKHVLCEIPQSERAPNFMNLNVDMPLTQKTLGLHWNVDVDHFLFVVDLPTRPTTRRGILSVTASVYDPLGFVAPLILIPKLLLQELCQDNRGWDEVVDGLIHKRWNRWLEDVQEIKSMKIPRCVKPNEFDKFHSSLHIFSDASETGYGAVAYLRLRSNTGKVNCSFIMGKSRVAPLKAVTIPRLELQAAVLSVRLMKHIKREMQLRIDDINFWSDSSIVLHYISNLKSRFKTFVANRVGFIRENTKLDQWRYVPSINNPADHASRGVRGKTVEVLSEWINGPEFLKEEIIKWPKTLEINYQCETSLLELKSDSRVMAVSTYFDSFDKLIAHYSSWYRLKKAVAWLTRYKTYMRLMFHNDSHLVMKIGCLSVDEMDNAEHDLICFVQKHAFRSHTDHIGTGSTNPSCYYEGIRSSLRKLNAVMMGGLIRVGGRISNSHLEMSAKHPIILPSKHPLTTLIIQYYHEAEGHMGTSYLLNKIRQKYWILKGAATIRQVVSRCIGCRMRSARPIEQIMADLPTARVEPDFPFASTGVDYFGPIYTKNGRVTTKCYGCVFTCLKTRAVHIEVAHSLSIDSFLMSFNRFTNRRGTPKEVFSDQGSNFVGAESELNNFVECLDKNRLNREMLARQIKWYFNPPYCSHRGGVWERIIRSIRRILSAVSSEQILTDESLSTYLTGVERILNDRPIVPVYDDPDQIEALSPSQLLLLQPNSMDAYRDISLQERYTRQWRQSQLLVDTFWRRWIKEYLPTLQQRQKWQRPRRNLQIGDLVLLIDTNQPRGYWLKGLVRELERGKDERVRGAVIQTRNGLVVRDVRKLCLLEGVDER